MEPAIFAPPWLSGSTSGRPGRQAIHADASITHVPLSNLDSPLAPGSHTIDPAWRTDAPAVRPGPGRADTAKRPDPGFPHDFLKRVTPKSRTYSAVSRPSGVHGGAEAAGSLPLRHGGCGPACLAISVAPRPDCPSMRLACVPDEQFCSAPHSITTHFGAMLTPGGP